MFYQPPPCMTVLYPAIRQSAIHEAPMVPAASVLQRPPEAQADAFVPALADRYATNSQQQVSRFLRQLPDRLWQRTTHIFTLCVASWGSADGMQLPNDAASASIYIDLAGFGAPYVLDRATAGLRRPQGGLAPSRRSREAPPPMHFADYAHLPTVALAACGHDTLCSITLTPVHELDEPVAALGETAVQVYEYADLKHFWRRYPKRAGLTPSYMPVVKLCRIVELEVASSGQ